MSPPSSVAHAVGVCDAVTVADGVTDGEPVCEPDVVGDSVRLLLSEPVVLRDGDSVSVGVLVPVSDGLGEPDGVADELAVAAGVALLEDVTDGVDADEADAVSGCVGEALGVMLRKRGWGGAGRGSG